jgi:hypothetical protein
MGIESETDVAAANHAAADLVFIAPQSGSPHGPTLPFAFARRRQAAFPAA